jgi:hypothetical protein
MVPDNVFVAESLEEYADRMPPGEVESANVLRRAASLCRRLPTMRIIHVQEEREDVNQAAARVAREATEKL